MKQGVRHHVVGAIRLAVERAGLGLVDGEIGVVEHEIAGDLLEPHAPQCAQQLPDFLDDELRVAITLDTEVAVELLAIELAEEVDLGTPGVGGTQVLERAPGRDRLHDGRRAARHVREMAYQGFPVVDGLDDDADVGRWDSVAGQHAFDLGWQLGRLRGERSQAD